MTFQRKLFLGFCLMTIPVVLIGLEALRSNREERLALEALGESMARTRTYAELETSMFNQSEAVWRFLSGMDPEARNDFRLIQEVVEYWQERWQGELGPDESNLAEDVNSIQDKIVASAERVFALYEAGDREGAYRLANQELKGRLLPALTRTNREVYRRAREQSVQGAYARLEDILAEEQRILFLVLALSLAVGILASVLISRGLARPVRDLKRAMALAGEGRLDHSIDVRSRDEIGDLARAFARMQESLKRSHEALAGLNADLEAKIRQLRDTQAQLIQSEKLASIGEMSAAVAHGLRNPLASLRAAAQLALHQMRATPAAGEHLKTIIAEVDRLDRRISHLLSFSRPAPFRPAPERLSGLLASLLPVFQPGLAQRGVRVDAGVPEGLPEVRVDRMQLEQALVEVISNALDAMPHGGLLSIRGWHAPEGDGRARVTLEVADTGEGIPDPVLPSVTNPFFTTRAEGTGLGLAIVKRYVAQNGGTLEIGSTRGKGTTVRISFPAAETAAAAEVSSDSPGGPGSQPAAAPGSPPAAAASSEPPAAPAAAPAAASRG